MKSTELEVAYRKLSMPELFQLLRCISLFGYPYSVFTNEGEQIRFVDPYQKWYDKLHDELMRRIQASKLNYKVSRN